METREPGLTTNEMGALMLIATRGPIEANGPLDTLNKLTELGLIARVRGSHGIYVATPAGLDFLDSHLDAS